MKARTWKKQILAVSTVVLLFVLALQLSPILVQAQYYARYTLNVTVNDSAAGTVTPTYGTYNYGETVKITEQPNYGFMFDGWYLNGEYQGILTTLYVTMYKDSAVTAVFTKRQATLTITVNPANGGNTAPLPQVWTYDYGTSIPVKEYASSGYVFDGWYLDGIYKGTGQTLDVTMNKDHQLAAYFATPETVTPKPNDTRIRTALAVSGKSSASYTNFNVVIDGWLTANGTSLVDYPILISYSITGGKSWKDLTLVRTNDKGVFSATWMPEVTGDYEIKATWEGDTTYTDATTIVNFAVNPVNENSIFSVTSNSTLTQLAFDSNTSKFSFSVSGPDGSTGYVNLYVPKSLMADTSKLTVLLDGTPISYTTQSGGDSWLVLFSYTHSTHAVTVNLSGTPAETAGSNLQNLLIYAIPVIAIVLAVVAVVALRRRKKA